MGETRMVCRVRDGIFSEHGIRQKNTDPEEDQVLCPDRGSSRLEPYAFDPDTPTGNTLDDPERA